MGATTGKPVRAARFLIVTIQGSFQFDGSCEVSFPVDTVANVSVAASGYDPQTKQLKPHYQRSVVIEVKFALTRAKQPTPTSGPQAMLGPSAQLHVTSLVRCYA